MHTNGIIFFAALAIVLFVLGFVFLHQDEVYRSWLPVTGKVASTVRTRDNEGEEHVNGTVEWHGPDGTPYHGWRGISHRAAIGDPVELLYDPQNPGDVIAAGDNRKTWAVWCFVLCAVTVGGGLRVHQVARRRRRWG